MGQMCSDKPENYDDEDLPDGQIKSLTIEDAEANWGKFMKTATKMIAISETNLKTLEVKINSNDNTNENQDWKVAYNNNEQKFNELKNELECHNEDVLAALKNFDIVALKANKDFPPKFLHDIIEMNNTIEDILDK